MIWCVEDDAGIRDIEVYALRSVGFEARGFSDGAAFWDALRAERPELVVLDVMLPGIDGIELLSRMRASDALRNIPVIMATAKGTEYDKIHGLDLGADYYLAKPFGVMELVSCVKACCAAADATMRSVRDSARAVFRSMPTRTPSPPAASASRLHTRNLNCCVSSWCTPAPRSRANSSWSGSGAPITAARRARLTCIYALCARSSANTAR